MLPPLPLPVSSSPIKAKESLTARLTWRNLLSYRAFYDKKYGIFIKISHYFDKNG
jgi:hypothetical protein